MPAKIETIIPRTLLQCADPVERLRFAGCGARAETCDDFDALTDCHASSTRLCDDAPKKRQEVQQLQYRSRRVPCGEAVERCGHCRLIRAWIPEPEDLWSCPRRHERMQHRQNSRTVDRHAGVPVNRGEF